MIDFSPPRSSHANERPAVTKRKRPRGESSTSPRRIQAIAEKQLAALEYRKMGYTFAQIATAVGYKSPQGAHEAVQSALNRLVREPAEAVLRLELERLDALFSKTFQAALAGDLTAVQSCLQVMTRRARLLGLDAPAKSQVARMRVELPPVLIHNMSSTEMHAAAARLVAKY